MEGGINTFAKGTLIGYNDKNGHPIKIGNTVRTDEGGWIGIVVDDVAVVDCYGGFCGDQNWEKFEILSDDEADLYWLRKGYFIKNNGVSFGKISDQMTLAIRTYCGTAGYGGVGGDSISARHYESHFEAVYRELRHIKGDLKECGKAQVDRIIFMDCDENGDSTWGDADISDDGKISWSVKPDCADRIEKHFATNDI